MALILSGTNGISSNGSNWILSPNDAGRFNLPTQPSFYAYFPTAASTTTQGFIFPFNTTRVNVGNHYNTSTYSFTAPIAGIYEFHAALLFRYASVNGQIECSFFRNGSNVGVRGQLYVTNNVSNAHTHCPMHLIIELSAGDSINTRLTSRVGGDIYYGENLSYFTGKLIG